MINFKINNNKIKTKQNSTKQLKIGLYTEFFGVWNL